MNETEWLCATDPALMLEFLRGKVSDRKMRRLSLAILTAEMAPDTNREYRTRMEIASRFADGSASLETLREWWGIEGNTWPERAYEWAAEVTVGEIADNPGTAIGIARLVSDIFGNPFRPVAINPAILVWNDGTVRRIAQGIYEERQMPEGTLDNSRLLILHDALLDAGCDNEELLTHLRSEGPHVRGCWAIDQLLGKE